MASITVTTTAQQIPVGAEHEIRSLSTNTQTIYFDSVSGVTSSTGVELLPGEALSGAITDAYPIYWVVTASGTADLRYCI